MLVSNAPSWLALHSSKYLLIRSRDCFAIWVPPGYQRKQRGDSAGNCRRIRSRLAPIPNSFKPLESGVKSDIREIRYSVGAHQSINEFDKSNCYLIVPHRKGIMFENSIGGRWFEHASSRAQSELARAMNSKDLIVVAYDFIPPYLASRTCNPQLMRAWKMQTF